MVSNSMFVAILGNILDHVGYQPGSSWIDEEIVRTFLRWVNSNSSRTECHHFLFQRLKRSSFYILLSPRSDNRFVIRLVI